jgi:glycosyltransferase involved in cell wall biosynthesis
VAPVRLCFWEWLGGDTPASGWEHGTNPGAGGSAFVTVRVVDLLARSRPDRHFILVDASGAAPRPRTLPDNVEFRGPVDWLAGPNDAVVIPAGALRAASAMRATTNAGRLIAWSHHPFDPALLGRRVGRRPEAVVSPGAFAVASNRMSRYAITHIPHPVAQVASVRARRPDNRKRFELVFMSSGLAIKGLPDVAALWHELRYRLPGARLHIIGHDRLAPGDEADMLRAAGRHRRVSALDVFCGDIADERVILHGRMGAERFALLAACHAGIVNPRGISESWCITAFEMMAVGLPIVSSGEFGMYESMRSLPNQMKRSRRGQVEAIVRLAQDADHWTESSDRAVVAVLTRHDSEPEIVRRWLAVTGIEDPGPTVDPLPDLWGLSAPRLRLARAVGTLILYRLALRRRWRRFMLHLRSN